MRTWLVRLCNDQAFILKLLNIVIPWPPLACAFNASARQIVFMDSISASCAASWSTDGASKLFWVSISYITFFLNFSSLCSSAIIARFLCFKVLTSSPCGAQISTPALRISTSVEIYCTFVAILLSRWRNFETVVTPLVYFSICPPFCSASHSSVHGFFRKGKTTFTPRLSSDISELLHGNQPSSYFAFSHAAPTEIQESESCDGSSRCCPAV